MMLSPLMAPEFSGAGTQPAFNADYVNRDNGRDLRSEYGKELWSQAAGEEVNFSQADMADTSKLNIILWRDEMGSRPVPSSYSLLILTMLIPTVTNASSADLFCKIHMDGSMTPRSWPICSSRRIAFFPSSP